MTDASQDKPDLRNDFPEGDLADGMMLVGQFGDEAVLLARTGAEVFAIGATCTYHGGPLGDGLMVAHTVRCPWHHACFTLGTGEALAAPALDATACWRVARRDGRIFVRDKMSEAGRQMPAKPQPTAGPPGHMVIVGGGAAGYAAAEMLRREGYGGGLTIISADDAPPYDRPNLSKDYLAGTAPEEWIPLRPPEFYAENEIELRLGSTATAIDLAGRRVMLGSGETFGFDRLLLAIGAEPIRLQVPGAELPHVRTLRSLADSRELIARPRQGSRAVVVGASFIGLEVAVHVVAPGARPMERVLGPALGDFMRLLHESHGVAFHLGRTVAASKPGGCGSTTARQSTPSWSWSWSGSACGPASTSRDRPGWQSIAACSSMNISKPAPPVFSQPGTSPAGPIRTAASGLRIEHWIVAERQGQIASPNMLGRREPYAAVPFSWSQHYDVSIDYVGHAAAWDEIAQDGDVSAHDAALRFRKASRTLALATIFRGRESLLAEAAMEQGQSP